MFNCLVLPLLLLGAEGPSASKVVPATAHFPTSAAIPASAGLPAASPQPVEDDSDDGWEFQVRPYLWGAGISGTAKVGRLPSVDFDKSFDEIVSDLDFAFMFTLEGRPKGSDFGLILDSIYMDVGGQKNNTTTGLEQLVLELDGAVRVATNVDVLFGARYIDLRASADNSMLGFSGDGSLDWIDPILGVRGATELGEHWMLSGRGDIGGFGIGSQFSWQLQGYVLWKATGWMDVGLGYRHLDIDYVSGSNEVDLSFSGPVLGVNFFI